MAITHRKLCYFVVWTEKDFFYKKIEYNDQHWEKVERNLAKDSRTAALWINYIKYVSTAQLFIDAERTSDWVLHINALKLILNLFAATGHNNYANSCHLYIQSATEMKADILKCTNNSC